MGAPATEPVLELRWYRKPGGSVHAFRGVSSLCGRFFWQASWAKADPVNGSWGDLADRCDTCAQLARPPAALTEDQLIAAHGGLPIDR